MSNGPDENLTMPGIEFTPEELALMNLLQEKGAENEEALAVWLAWLEKGDNTVDTQHGSEWSEAKDEALVDLWIKRGLLLLAAGLEDQASDMFNDALYYATHAQRNDLLAKLHAAIWQQIAEDDTLLS